MKIRSGILGHIALASIVACIALPFAQARTVKQKKLAAKAQLVVADRMRDSLLSTPESNRDRDDYFKVMEAYRKVYYTAPSWVHADDAVLAVAQLLDDQGRVFNDAKSYKDAIGQLVFLRREYPGSRHRVEALYTIAQIYRDDLKDAGGAKDTFQNFVKQYPHSHLAPQAREAMVDIGNAEADDPFAPKSGRRKHGSRRSRPQRDARATHAAPEAHGVPEAKVAWADLEQVKPPVEKRKVREEARAARPEPQSKSARGNAKTNADAEIRSTRDNAEAEARPARDNDNTKAEAKPAGMQVQDHDVSADVPNPGVAQPSNGMARLTSIRHWSTPDYVRVAIDLDQEVKYRAGRIAHPDRIFFDLYGVKLAHDLMGKTFDVEAGFLHRIRVAQFSANRARVVLDVDDVAEYSAFLLPNPYRLIIDIHGKAPAAQVAEKGKKSPAPEVAAETTPAAEARPEKKLDVAARDANSGQPQPDVTIRHIHPAADSPDSAEALQQAEDAPAGPMKGRKTTEVAKAEPPKIISDHNADDNTNDDAFGSPDTDKATTTRPTSGPTYQAIAPRESSRKRKADEVKEAKEAARHADRTTVPASTTHVASPTADGDRSLIRALGLKIGKIVVDAGHGGHDTGTIGPNGLEEKDLVLDVALRLGKLLQNKLGAEVVYTRDDDTFIPLETRTAIANKEQADLFISVHANSSRDPSARGVETYYLNFTSSPDALEVAARENAVSQQSIHQLQDLVKKIALKEKIEESREFAADVQQALYKGENAKNPGERNRGVKKAPFVVLIGANMPSILAEISFVSNPHDARKLKTNAYRQQIAESLYKGVAKYIHGLSGVRVAAQLDRHDADVDAALK
ncbi:MAG TPA: N-acetylmuramoyl-L-alanine amidase [Candidatus Angelobacter sp.]|nr:N-acetylmuramoyl-L-alanine amidase [Candidatus Angelobacter sp.]